MELSTIVNLPPSQYSPRLLFCVACFLLYSYKLAIALFSAYIKSERKNLIGFCHHYPNDFETCVLKAYLTVADTALFRVHDKKGDSLRIPNAGDAKWACKVIKHSWIHLSQQEWKCQYSCPKHMVSFMRWRKRWRENFNCSIQKGIYLGKNT